MKVTIPTRIAGKMIELEYAVHCEGSEWAYTEEIIAVRIGRGAKVHRTAMGAHMKNGQWVVIGPSNVRNSNNLTVVGMAAEFEGTSAATEQNYYGSI